VLEPLARDPSRAALVVDFDGTLAPIVDHPDDARALPAALDVLAALVVELALVGVVSGRPVDFLRDRIGIDGVRLVGQYGLEAAVRVGVRSEEAPPELLARADVVVDGPAGLARLLGTLTGA
jgi:trehalose 6-phosphate phosphatase